MSITEAQMFETNMETDSLADPTPSVMEQLRKRRAEMAQGREPYEIEIPGYSGELVVRYHMIEWAQLKRIQKKMMNSKRDDRELLIQADLLVTACQEILFKDPQTGEYKPLNTERTIRFDEHLARILGFESTSARDTLFQTFQNDLAVTAQANLVMQWLVGESDIIDEEFLGES